MPDLRTFRAAALATLVAVVGLAHADAPADAVARNAALHVEGIPPIPSALAAKIAPYTEFKPRTAVSWHPQRRELVVATRAVNTTRADRHDREEKRRARLVFAGGQRRSRLREEGERRLPVLCDGQLSRNDAAPEVVRANADRARTPIAQPQEQGQAHPAPGIDALRGLRARLFEEPELATQHQVPASSGRWRLIASTAKPTRSAAPPRPASPRRRRPGLRALRVGERFDRLGVRLPSEAQRAGPARHPSSTANPRSCRRRRGSES